MRYSYAANDDGRVGVYVAAHPLTPDNAYFEVEILDTGMVGAIGTRCVFSIPVLQHSPPDSLARPGLMRRDTPHPHRARKAQRNICMMECDQWK